MLSEEDKLWINDWLGKVETTFLREFHKWAAPIDVRQKSHAAASRAIDAEAESLSDRLKNLEGRKHVLRFSMLFSAVNGAA